MTYHFNLSFYRVTGTTSDVSGWIVPSVSGARVHGFRTAVVMLSEGPHGSSRFVPVTQLRGKGPWHVNSRQRFLYWGWWWFVSMCPRLCSNGPELVLESNPTCGRSAFPGMRPGALARRTPRSNS